jgi:hypothetical protein
MARKRNLRESRTPSPDAPTSWSGISSADWQKKGRWAAPQHHMCTYMAMFPPELPHYFIQRFTKPGDRVLDPFSGRGTTAVEAAAQSRIGIGNDLNPLAVALTRGKLSNPQLSDVLERLDALEKQFDPSKWSTDGEPERIQLIYHVETLKQLVYLKSELDWSKPSVDAFIVAVLMGAMHGSSKGFLSLPMPNTFSMSSGYIRRKVREEPERFACPNRDTFEVLRGRAKRQLGKGHLPGEGEALEGDVRDLGSKIESDSIHLIFTSPPYLKVIKYGQYNWIRLWFLTESGSHEEVDEKLDDTHDLEEYLAFMKESMKVTLPLLDQRRGLSCWAIGDVGGLNLAWEVWHHAARTVSTKLPDGTEIRYRLLAIIEDNVPSEEKVTRLWKTQEFVVRSIDVCGGPPTELLRTRSVEEAGNFYSNLVSGDQNQESQIELISVDIDLSGKATPIDRILIMCPSISKPASLRNVEQLNWMPFHIDLKE